MDESDFLLIITEAALISSAASLACRLSLKVEDLEKSGFVQNIEASARNIIEIIETNKPANPVEGEI